MSVELRTKPLGPDSNSYITLAEAASIIAATTYEETAVEAWDELSDADKKTCLTLGAAAIDRFPLRGRKVNRTIPEGIIVEGVRLTITDAKAEQALAFPRTVQHNRRVIPDEVKQAQCDLAVTIFGINWPPVGDSGQMAEMDEVKSVRIGPLSVTFRDRPKRESLAFALNDTTLLMSSLAALRLNKYMTAVRGRVVSGMQDTVIAALDDRVSTTTSVAP